MNPQGFFLWEGLFVTASYLLKKGGTVMKNVQIDQGNMLRRAMDEWFKSGGTIQPSSNISELTEHNGKMYVILSSVNGPLAVYRIKKDGSLKRLERWPVEFYRLGMYE
jgi:hypothetical protein